MLEQVDQCLGLSMIQQPEHKRKPPGALQGNRKPTAPWHANAVLHQHPISPQAAAGGGRRALAGSIASHRLRLRCRGWCGCRGLGPRLRAWGWCWWVGALFQRVAWLNCDSTHACLAAAHTDLDVTVVAPLGTPAVLDDPAGKKDSRKQQQQQQQQR
jgi:hypothetical protein